MKFFIYLSIFCIALPAASLQADPGWIKVPAGAYTPLWRQSNTTNLLQDNLESNAALEANLQAFDTIKVGSFLLSKHPVTNAEFKKFLVQNSAWRKTQIKRLFAESTYLDHWGEAGPSKSIANQPVTMISWFAAKTYCSWAGGRLPTTDEWEYVASLDDREKRDKAILEWYAQPSNVKPSGEHFVGSLGVYDMHGRIWEWTEDFNSALVTGESRLDSNQSRQMFCGAGAVASSDASDYATFMRYAFRSSLKGSYTSANLGFRCAKDIATL